MTYGEKAIIKHKEWKGKIKYESKASVATAEDLSIAYTPALPLLVWRSARMWICPTNTPAAAISSPLSRTVPPFWALATSAREAGMPVMEGKCVLFKAFGDVDAIPLCVRSKSVDDIVKVVSLLAGSFGGINLEDISAPRCFEIERRLKEVCDIPIFHDDQHGTAVVTVAAAINALKIVNKKPEDVTVVVNGAGAAGIACSRLLQAMGVKDIILLNSKGIVYAGKEGLNSELQLYAPETNPRMVKGGLKEALVGADIFLGVSVPGIVDEAMVKSMNRDPIIFACANPFRRSCRTSRKPPAQRSSAPAAATSRTRSITCSRSRAFSEALSTFAPGTLTTR